MITLVDLEPSIRQAFGHSYGRIFFITIFEVGRPTSNVWYNFLCKLVTREVEEGKLFFCLLDFSLEGKLIYSVATTDSTNTILLFPCWYWSHILCFSVVRKVADSRNTLDLHQFTRASETFSCVKWVTTWWCPLLCGTAMVGLFRWFGIRQVSKFYGLSIHFIGSTHLENIVL